MLNKSELDRISTEPPAWAHDAAQDTRSGNPKHQLSQGQPGNTSPKKVDPTGTGIGGSGGKKTVGGQHETKTQPTIAEFLDASAAEYSQGSSAGDLVPIVDHGKKVLGENIGDGLYASAWFTPKGQVIVSFEGTSGFTPTGQNEELLKAQQTEDVDISDGKVTKGERAAVAFTRQVMTNAAHYGISSSNIFVTGHSLGAVQAEYVAQQTGLGGMGFEPTGLPRSTTGVGNGDNFVDVLTHGDPVAFDASDVRGEQPIAPSFVPGGGSLAHYGKLLVIGDPAQDAQLTSDAQKELSKVESGQITAAASVGDLLSSRVQFHVLATQAHDLGVSVPPSLQSAVGTGIEPGAVDDVGSETLSELLRSLN